jgi:hypothetical protein
MLDIFNTPSPQSANYQEFYYCGSGGTEGSGNQTWLKPRGASMVRFMLIGAGGGGGNGTTAQGGGGGGSGAITSWIGPAIFIPDSLIIRPGLGGVSGLNGEPSRVRYLTKSGNYILLAAAGGNSGSTATAAGTGGAASSNNYFGASGIFTSIAGQDGAIGSGSAGGSSVLVSAETFLSGGAGGNGGATSGSTVTPNYGYPVSVAALAGANKGEDGFFITKPILVGRGGAGGNTSTTAGGAGGRGGIGCGGGGSGEDAVSGGRGGDGAVFIWAW